MNYLYIGIEVVLVFLLMLLFYKFGKKEGLFVYIGFMASLLSVIIFKSVDILSFEVDLGTILIMGIFVCSNIIVQRYGIDEIKSIIKAFIFPYSISFIILSLTSLMIPSEYNLITNDYYDSLFGYDFNNIRLLVGALLSVSFTLWYNAYIYYYIRKNKNNYLFSNIGSMIAIQFAESIIFVIISYVGVFGFDMLFGMIAIRYLFKVVIGFVGLLPFIVGLKMKS